MLSQNHADFFKLDAADTKIVPIEKLHSTKVEQPHSIENAREYMAMAKRGEIDKRDPLVVRDNGDGTYDVIDGNATLEVTRQEGWTDMPVRVGRLLPTRCSTTEPAESSGDQVPKMYEYRRDGDRRLIRRLVIDGDERLFGLSQVFHRNWGYEPVDLIHDTRVITEEDARRFASPYSIDGPAHRFDEGYAPGSIAGPEPPTGLGNRLAWDIWQTELGAHAERRELTLDEARQVRDLMDVATKLYTEASEQFWGEPEQ